MLECRDTCDVMKAVCVTCFGIIVVIVTVKTIIASKMADTFPII